MVMRGRNADALVGSQLICINAPAAPLRLLRTVPSRAHEEPRHAG